MWGKPKAKDHLLKKPWLKTMFKNGLTKSLSHLFHRKKQAMASEKNQQTYTTIISLWDKHKGKVDIPYYSSYNFRRVAYVLDKQGKSEKALIAEARLCVKLTYWMYYPKPDEALKFAEALKHMGPGVPAQRFPGCVGIISGDISPKTDSFRSIKIDTIQGSFTQKECPELSKSLTRKHGGWREHILDHIFKKAIEEKIQTVSFRLPFFWVGESRLRTMRLAKIFLRAAKRNGFKRKPHSGKEVMVVERL